MAISRIQVVLARLSGLVEDVVVNTWHFQTSGAVTTGQREIIAAQVGNFYSAIDQLLHNSISGAANAHQIKHYDLDVGGPGEADDLSGSPARIDTFTLTPSVAQGLPEEVAVCLSMRGSLSGVQEEVGTTRPAARRRGRLFLGPWSTAILTTQSTTGQTRVLASTRTTILDAATALHTALEASGVDHVVYSRKNGTAVPVVEYSVDDAFDTQRRRGVARNVRSTAAP